ncbi:hypothetical protein K7432_007709 [Basidiobolus ranarum]|uniref:Peptidase S8/S53 domain-containing protein n=1 Tax=Basidiobolus ranarum TaxID=34480 RepID=A0ABR2WT03_9FUNG
MSPFLIAITAIWTLCSFTSSKHLIVFKPGSDVTKSQVLSQWTTHFNIETLQLNDKNTTASDALSFTLPVQTIGNFQWTHGEFKASELEELKKLSDVAYIEPDVRVTAYDVQKKPPNWGIDRIDQRKGTDREYRYPRSAGEGVIIYSIDSGVNIDHEEFEGRATNGPIFNDDSGPEDINGHGTFVAAVAIGKNFGVAKKSHLVSLKALDSDGYGSLSNILEALHWVVSEYKKNSKQKSVVNLSLGTTYSQLMNDAIEEAMKLGIHFTIAAGNGNDNACNYSPSSVKSALVVGATTDNDEIGSFSNVGPCVSIYAPGVGIKSAWKDGPTSTNTRSGTSMASPHVAGVIALILGEQDLSPLHMKQWIQDQATQIQLKKSEKNSLAATLEDYRIPLLYVGPSVTGEADSSDTNRLLPNLWKPMSLTLILYCYWQLDINFLSTHF